jgi:hypothetical protein
MQEPKIMGTRHLLDRRLLENLTFQQHLHLHHPHHEILLLGLLGRKIPLPPDFLEEEMLVEYYLLQLVVLGHELHLLQNLQYMDYLEH